MSAKTVLPASEAIGRAVRDNHSLPSLAAGMAGRCQHRLPLLSITPASGRSGRQPKTGRSR
jgi:hypothetical protein